MPAPSSMPSSPNPECFADRLLQWWARHGRKDLPWQHPRTPYRVWVSEIMLQQTQVATVIPYFERWVARLPGIETLAAAPEDEVLSLWSGLGYYARARNLHKAARICVERFDGALPDSHEALKELPGIGPSTANAIISQAFDRPAVVLDGNAKRVLARHVGTEGWPGDSKIHRALWSEAEKRLPGARGADYSQAIMDLGALVCTRNAPDCAQCPVAGDCRALELGATDRIPAARPRKEIPEKTLHMLVVRDADGRILLQRRPPTGIWGGLWSLPEGRSAREARERLGFGRKAVGSHERGLPEIRHRLTHLFLQIKPALLTVSTDMTLECESAREGSELAWFSREARMQLGLPRPVEELLRTLDNRGQSKNSDPKQHG